VVVANIGFVQALAPLGSPAPVVWTDTVNGVIGECGANTCSNSGTLAANQSVPYGIAADRAKVYWTNQGNGGLDAGSILARGYLDAGNAAADGEPLVVASGSNLPRSIAVDADGNVFWTTKLGDILAWTKTTGATTSLATGQAGPRSITADASAVYWVNAAGGEVMKAAKQGGSSPIVLASGQSSPWAIAVDDAYLYWVNNTAAGAVVRMPK
jgi:hypothetical protein